MKTTNKLTGDRYYRDLTEFGATVGHKALASITREDVRKFIHTLQKRNMKPKTIHNRLVTLRAFLRHHHLSGIVVNKLDASVVHKKIPHRYSTAQVTSLLAASTFEDKLVWQSSLAAGLREQELSNLGWEDVLFEPSLLHLHAKPDLGFRLKDAEERQIPLPTELLEKLRERRELRPTDRLVFPTENGKLDGHLLRRLEDVAFIAGPELWLVREPRRIQLQEPCRVRSVAASLLPADGNESLA